MNKHSTIIYTMNKSNFKYHISKSKLKKGSIISKKNHPLKEVNDFREKLLKKGLLLDNGDNYILKDSIKIGAIMAYNLHCGEFKNEIESNNDIVINSLDESIIDEFKIKNIFSTDAKLRNSLSLDSMELLKLQEIEMDFSVLSDHNPNKFSKLEKIFCDLLMQEKIISTNVRHGIIENNECDIVDENKGIQIEIITEFKNRLKKDKAPHKNVDWFMIESVDNNLIKTSKALLNKFVEKTYTDKYDIELGIFCFGSKNSVKSMLEVLQGNLKNSNIKNDFKKVHILWYDFITNKYYLCSPDNKINKEVQDLKLELVKMKIINFDDMQDGKKYLMTLKNIFGKESAIFYAEKNEILHRIKELRVKV